MSKIVPHVRNKIRLHEKYLLDFNSLGITSPTFLVIILVKYAFKISVTTIISLYMLSLENGANEKSEIAENTSKAGA